MIKKITLFFLSVTMAFTAMAQKIQSPSEFLGYKLGTRYTYHSRIADYVNYIAKTAPNTKLVPYGTTNEGRPLMAIFVASAENIGRLEEIRKNNLGLAGMGSAAGTVSANTPVIVWLSYNVHGNEPSSSEAAMQTLYDMVDPSNTRTQAWLKNTVVVIDPCLNPDGRDRYVNFYNGVRGATPDANPASREHQEPWPGGRTNHYFFDLNRDWAWQVQKETKGRVALYNQWLPEVHVDFHEQGYNSPYYFAPAAEPFHKDITPWQREFQIIIGKNNAKYFDKNGWAYFTKEIFDLLYPSYGDTYPLYNGSIGMTYEQGGGPSGGLAVQTRTGDTLTLVDRIAHHHSNSLSTVEAASANAQKALNEFKKYFDNGRTNPPGIYKGYVIKNDNADKITMLTQLFDRNGIKYGFGLNGSVSGYNYTTGKTESYKPGDNDLVVSAYQSKSVLLNVLLEPKTFIADSNTYDITGWSLPYAYGLKAYAVKEQISPAKQTSPPADVAVYTTDPAYAYVSTWQSVNDVKFLAALFKHKIKVRYSEIPFEAQGKKFTAGSLIISRSGNESGDFDKTIQKIAADCNHNLTQLNSGFVDKGADMGSSYIKYISAPRVLLVSGDATSSEALGEIWHFFEQELGYPVSLVNYSALGRVRWADVDVAIFPDGNYDGFPSEKLTSWVQGGGKLIALQSAVSQLADKKGFNIKMKENKPEEPKGKDKGKDSDVKLYANREKESIKSNVPGAIYRMSLDNTHPLGFGLCTNYYTLKMNDEVYDFLGDDGWNVGTIKKDNYVSGFVGQKSKARLTDGMLIGVQSLGRGSVVYLADDPLFRSFWENGKLLFSNAVFMVQ